jgi:protoheme IX farnesyltransferase
MAMLNSLGANGMAPRDGHLRSPSGSTAARSELFSQISDVLKLRIGVIMMLTALVAMVITPGPQPSLLEMLVLAFAILISAGSAGAFNQYFEVDLDRRVARTCNRPFVTGYFHRGPMWLVIILLLLVAGVGSAALVLNLPSAIYIFLGAFFYAIVYTVWLKRRSWTNIVIGGASGSFAVLAGAAAVDPNLGPVPIMLALVLFLWTPSHFWSLAIAKNKDYTRTGVPMLPVIIGNRRCAEVVLINTLLLVAIAAGWWRLFYLSQLADAQGSVPARRDEEFFCIAAAAGIVACRRSARCLVARLGFGAAEISYAI